MRVYPYGTNPLKGKSLLACLLLAVLLLAGCISVNVVPTALPLPEAPELTFISQTGQICLSEADANKLNKFLQQLDAFRHAWERLRAP